MRDGLRILWAEIRAVWHVVTSPRSAPMNHDELHRQGAEAPMNHSSVGDPVLIQRVAALRTSPAAALPACPSCGNTDHYCGACGGQMND